MGMLLMMTPLRWMGTGDEVAMTTHGGLTLRASLVVVVPGYPHEALRCVLLSGRQATTFR